MKWFIPKVQNLKFSHTKHSLTLKDDIKMANRHMKICSLRIQECRSYRNEVPLPLVGMVVAYEFTGRLNNTYGRAHRRSRPWYIQRMYCKWMQLLWEDVWRSPAKLIQDVSRSLTWVSKKQFEEIWAHLCSLQH